MWWIFLTLTVLAEPETEPETLVPVLYSGIDEQASLVRVSRASKRPIDTLSPLTVVDISKNAPISVIEHYDSDSTSLKINTCPGASVSNMHIRKLTQKADNYLNYYELDHIN